MKYKLWLYGALVLNIASAFNWYGVFFNLMFALHCALVIFLLSIVFTINLTINNNIQIPKETDKKKYEFMVINYNKGYINSRLQELQEEGWEIAGNSNIYNGQYDGNTYVSIPLKRFKSNN
jgi:hypothetical protein